MRVTTASCVAASIALTGIGFASVGASAASVGGPSNTSSAHYVRVGGLPILPAGAQRLGPLAFSTELQVLFVLQPRDPAGLANFVTQVSTPGSPLFHQYLRKGEFSSRFGPTQSAVATVEQSLRAEGLHPGTITPDGLLLPVTASAGRLEAALSIGFEQMRVGSRVAYANTAAPRLPVAAAHYVYGVVGLDDLYPLQPLSVASAKAAASQARHAATKSATHVSPHTSGPQPCSAARTAASEFGGVTSNQIASAYEFSPLYSAGDLGAGVKVGLFELEPNYNTDTTTFATCYGITPNVSYTTVGKGPGGKPGGPNSNGEETALDIQQVLGLAPDAAIDVYEGPNSNSDAGPLEVYSEMIAPKAGEPAAPQVISTSWGECELALYQGGTGASGSDNSNAAADAENSLFAEAAADGQSVFAAAGDSGSEDCEGEVTGQNGLAVDDPGSQPDVTSAGGTSFKSLGPPLTQTVWNSDGGAGGGGISMTWPMPSYQSGAAKSLNVINSASSGTPCKAAKGTYCREVPDVSADADPNTGVTIYYGGSGGSWTTIGGTSAAAPLWGAVAAILDADPHCTSAPGFGKTLGFVNPVLYKVASSYYHTILDDITSGDNNLNGTGAYKAGVGFDMASGLGTPIVSGLAAAICHAAEAPAAPAGVTATAGHVTTPGSGQVNLSWTAPYNNGSSITGYTVKPSPACAKCTGLTSKGVYTPISGLAPGTRYTLSVTATNAAGTGPAGTSGAIMVYTVPSAAGSVKAAADGAKTAKVTFSAPSSNGGEAIKQYQVLISPACAECGGTVVKTGTAVITGLTANGTYRFTVKATNAAGTGPVSAASNPVKVS
jgi:subtilase family serine protease